MSGLLRCPFLIEGFLSPPALRLTGILNHYFFSNTGRTETPLARFTSYLFQTLIYLSSGRIPVVSQDHDHEVLMKAMAY